MRQDTDNGLRPKQKHALCLVLPLPAAIKPYYSIGERNRNPGVRLIVSLGVIIMMIM